jgi:hypothetical protein
VQSSSDRILTTHCGSLPRSEMLTDLLLRQEAGESIDLDALAREAERGIEHVLQQQMRAGMDIVSDGEQPRVGLRRTSRYVSAGSVVLPSDRHLRIMTTSLNSLKPAGNGSTESPVLRMRPRHWRRSNMGTFLLQRQNASHLKWHSGRPVEIRRRHS